MHDECEGARFGESEQSRVRICDSGEETTQYGRVYCGITERTARWSRVLSRLELVGFGSARQARRTMEVWPLVSERWEAERAEQHKIRNVVFVGSVEEETILTIFRECFV